MNRKTALGVVGCLGLTLVSCKTATSVETGGLTIESTAWELAEILNVSGEMVPPVHMSLTYFKLSDGKVSGNAGANNFSGSYELDGSKIKFLPMASNMMMGTPELMAQEGQFMKGLGETVDYQIVGEELQLRNADGKVIIKMKPRIEPTLASNVWKATGVNNGKGGVQSLVAKTEITIEFNDEGQVSGSAGCNTFTGGYEVEDDKIKFSPLATTRMMCSEPAGVMEQETAFLQALGNSKVWKIQAGSLELRDENGSLQAKFNIKE